MDEPYQSGRASLFNNKLHSWTLSPPYHTPFFPLYDMDYHFYKILEVNQIVNIMRELVLTELYSVVI